jgi:orotidine-5'-phosphate decarboxylase
MTSHFADRFLHEARVKGAPVCVGIDPVLAKLPAALRPVKADGSLVEDDAGAALEAIRWWGMGLLKAVAKHVPCVKFQSACFERYLWEGVKLQHELTLDARRLGLLVINDAKRGDIGISAEHYAAGCLGDTEFTDLGRSAGADALTANAYLGHDSLEPLIKLAGAQGKGLFALVRTSNPGGDALQSLALADGRTVSDAVADIVVKAGEGHVGKSGYSLIGAVVGATKPQDAVGLRKRMPQQLFLVPGFGAQGGTAADVKPCFKSDGTGAIITASRSVIFAYEKPATSDWQGAIEAGAADLNKQIRGIL